MKYAKINIIAIIVFFSVSINGFYKSILILSKNNLFNSTVYKYFKQSICPCLAAIDVVT